MSNREQLTGPSRAAPQRPDPVDDVLQASCAALMALEVVRTRAADDQRVNGRVSMAIAILRRAITDLREQQGAGGGVLSHGFVAGRPLGDADPTRPA